MNDDLDSKLAQFFAGLSAGMDEAAAGEARLAHRAPDDTGLAYYRGQVDAFDVMFSHAQKLGLPHSDQGCIGDTRKETK